MTLIPMWRGRPFFSVTTKKKSTLKIRVYRRSTRPDRWGVALSIDHQTFRLDIEDTKKRARWTAEMLRIACRRLLGIK